MTFHGAEPFDRPLAFQIPAHMEADLNAWAARSGRTTSQMARYITRWWLTSSRTLAHAPQINGGDREISFRVPASTRHAINDAAISLEVNRATILRAAIGAWLAQATPDSIDQPLPALATATG